MRDQVLADLYRRDASLREKINRAEGYAVFSNVGVNLIFASVAAVKESSWIDGARRRS